LKDKGEEPPEKSEQEEGKSGQKIALERGILRCLLGYTFRKDRPLGFFHNSNF